MGYGEVFNEIVENKLKDMHTAYLGKVISFDGTTATVQPLGMYKQINKAAQKQAIVSNIPVVHSARYKMKQKTVEAVTGVSLSTSKSDGYISAVSPNVTKRELTYLEPTPLAAGDIVICVCCDRDISQARKGINAVPAQGHNSISDSVVVGVL